MVIGAVAATVGRAGGFLVVAVALVAVGLAVGALGRNAPAWEPAQVPFTTRMLAAVKLRTAIDLSALYAITFGGLVAFGVYLPTFLQDIYGLTSADAAARAGGFIVLATLARPVGGALLSNVALSGLVHTWWRFVIAERLGLSEPGSRAVPDA